MKRMMLCMLASAVVLSCFSERVSAPHRNGGAALCGADPGANVIQIRDYAFHPAELTVNAGATVTWVNCDSDLHTSTGTGSTSWNSGLLSPNGTFTRTFGAAGRFAYRCDPHPFMTAAVVVR